MGGLWTGGRTLPSGASDLVGRMGKRWVPRSLLRGVVWHRGPEIPELAVRTDVGNDDVRSDDCGSKCGESVYARRLRAKSLIERRGSNHAMGKALTQHQVTERSLTAGKTLDTTPGGCVAIRRRSGLGLRAAAARLERLHLD